MERGSARRRRLSAERRRGREAVGDEVVLVHLRTNRIYTLNRTGARFWELLEDGTISSAQDACCSSSTSARSSSGRRCADSWTSSCRGASGARCGRLTRAPPARGAAGRPYPTGSSSLRGAGTSSSARARMPAPRSDDPPSARAGPARAVLGAARRRALQPPGARASPRLEGSTDGELASRPTCAGVRGAARAEGHLRARRRRRQARRVIRARPARLVSPLLRRRRRRAAAVHLDRGAASRPARLSEVNRAALADHLAHRWPDPARPTSRRFAACPRSRAGRGARRTAGQPLLVPGPGR